MDSTDVSIALLNPHGMIFRVNRAWRAFAKANGYGGPDCGVGQSYLDLCERALALPVNPDDVAGAAQSIKAIEDVLAGRRESAKLLYPCHAPNEERWFEMKVTPLDLGEERRGAVVQHFNVTERTLAESELRRQGELLNAISTELPVVIFQRFRRDGDGHGDWDYVYASEGVSEAFALEKDVLRRLVGEHIFDVVLEDDRARVSASYLTTVARGGGVWRAEFQLAAADGTLHWMDAVVRLKVEDGRERESLWVLHDVSQQKLANQRLRDAYEHDALTGLFSRTYFEAAAGEALERYVRSRRTFAAVILDIDGFSEVNEVYGLAVGDELLRQVSATLLAAVRADDVVARIGADKFGVLCAVPSLEVALEIGGRLIEELRRSYDVDEHGVAVTLSAGVALPRDVATLASDLLHDADSACDRAHASGGNTCLAYSEEMRLESVARVTLRDALRDAVARGDQFELHYQPEVEIRTGRIVACEALLRWHHPSCGQQSPARFIPIAEQSGLIVPIGEWVMREACRQYQAWRAAGLAPVPIAVNVSAVQFAHADVLALISHALAESGAPPGAIDIEITESVLVDCSSGLVDELAEIRRLGVRIALDDFGTGFSSLGYLRRLPLSLLKIDQNFARGAVQNASDAAIVRSIVGLASELGLRTIAEGVETAEQLAFLRETGCDEMQGYFVSPALPPGDFARFLADQAPLVAEKMRSPLRTEAS